MRAKTISFILTAVWLSGELASAAQVQSNRPVVSAEPTVYDEVAAKLDAGGSLYGYLSTDQWLGTLSARIAEIRSFVLGIPELKGKDRAQAESVFTLLEGFAKRSGVESVHGSVLLGDGSAHRTQP
jgi:hypothetical protein